MGQKSLLLTYVFWLFGGIFGLHHIYLCRDFHALVWWFTGGGFVAGWLRDSWRIPEYVKDANNDPTYRSQLIAKIIKDDKPSTGFIRYVGMLAVADFFSLMISLVVYDKNANDLYPRVLRALLTPLAASLGVYLVGNIGRHEGRFIPLLLTYITSPFYFLLDKPETISSSAAIYIFNNYCKQWRRTHRSKTFFQRAKFFILYGSLYLLLWSYWLYFNCEIIYKNDEEIKCTEAIKNFFTSPLWKEFYRSIKELWEISKVHGWRVIWTEFVETLDPVGETNAIRVLGLVPPFTQQEISARYRKLSLEWHPDKHKDPEAKKIAQEKFIEIQEAYEVLSKIKSQRMEKNIKNQDEDHHHTEL